MGRTILLTGLPGVGKTTVITRVVTRLPGHAAGFYTAEIREKGKRLGFKLVTLDGREGTLAHVNIHSGPHVSKYGVDLAVLDALGVGSIRSAVGNPDVVCVVIDEIGKMELLSEPFRQSVWDAIHSPKLVLATIMLHTHPWADRLKAHPNALLLNITPENRDEAVERVLSLYGVR